MKFVPLIRESAAPRELQQEYKAGRAIGVVTLGREHFFFRKLMTAYYIAYGDIERYFRRIVAIPAKMGCCSGEMQVENVVRCAGGRELAEIQMPGEKAALALMDELKSRAPGAAVGRPIPQEESK